MNFTGIISITGISGLSKVIAKTKSGLVAEELLTKKRFHVHAEDKISALEDICIYTSEGEHPLKEVFKTIKVKENNGPAPVTAKADPKDLKMYFEGILPNYDAARVYVSDIKKVVSWYNILQGADLLKEEEVKADAAEEGTAKKTAVKAGVDVKKTAAKKTAKPHNVAGPAAAKAPSVKKNVRRKTGE
jgi:hypothetical protein